MSVDLIRRNKLLSFPKSYVLEMIDRFSKNANSQTGSMFWRVNAGQVEVVRKLAQPVAPGSDPYMRIEIIQVNEVQNWTGSQTELVLEYLRTDPNEQWLHGAWELLDANWKAHLSRMSSQVENDLTTKINWYFEGYLEDLWRLAYKAAAWIAEETRKEIHVTHHKVYQELEFQRVVFKIESFYPEEGCFLRAKVEPGLWAEIQTDLFKFKEQLELTGGPTRTKVGNLETQKAGVGRPETPESLKLAIIKKVMSRPKGQTIYLVLDNNHVKDLEGGPWLGYDSELKLNSVCHEQTLSRWKTEMKRAGKI